MSKDLTEQWKNGEQEFYLRHKDFYFNGYYAEGMLAYYQHDRIMPVDEVLAPVPNFEKWEQLQNWADFTNDYHELREKLEIADYKNAELKELLRDCYEFLMNRDVIFKRNSQYLKLAEQYHYILNKIDEVLK